jgi:hypothetical protein
MAISKYACYRNNPRHRWENYISAEHKKMNCKMQMVLDYFRTGLVAKF